MLYLRLQRSSFSCPCVLLALPLFWVVSALLVSRCGAQPTNNEAVASHHRCFYHWIPSVFVSVLSWCSIAPRRYDSPAASVKRAKLSGVGEETVERHSLPIKPWPHISDLAAPASPSSPVPTFPNLIRWYAPVAPNPTNVERLRRRSKINRVVLQHQWARPRRRRLLLLLLLLLLQYHPQRMADRHLNRGHTHHSNSTLRSKRHQRRLWIMIPHHRQWSKTSSSMALAQDPVAQLEFNSPD